MKNILVPVDYSVHSDHAVRYAIEMAKKINAAIHFCHGLEISQFNSMAGVMAWSAEIFSKMQVDAEEDLRKYIQQLKNELLLKDLYFPKITYSIETGSVKQFIAQLIEKQHFDLVIMGVAGAGKLARFFLGSNSRDVIEKTNVPILLIPKEANYQQINKIAFATDLRESDLNAIHSLARLFCLYTPEILLAHVDEQHQNSNDPNSQVNLFLNRVTCKINYSKIYYRHINAAKVDEGLQWLIQNGQINMMVMVHRHPSIFTRILNGSHTQKLAKTIQLPLLVMPEDNTPISW
jgi:nucleotide-binding universal stress UspA family protein